MEELLYKGAHQRQDMVSMFETVYSAFYTLYLLQFWKIYHVPGESSMRQMPNRLGYAIFV